MWTPLAPEVSDETVMSLWMGFCSHLELRHLGYISSQNIRCFSGIKAKELLQKVNEGV